MSISFYAFYIVAYLIGSIPFGLLLTYAAGEGDIRKTGSGNIGATNVLRAGNKSLALATLFLDVSKGIIAIFLTPFLFKWYITGSLSLPSYYSSEFFNEAALKYGFCAILGHCFPIWLKFKGGKGVATTFGVLFAAVPWAGFLAAVTWGIVAGFTRYSSLAALSAIAMTPLFSFIYYGIGPTVFTAMIALLVFWRHKENIQRLMAGTESKIGSKKKDQNEPTADTE